MRTFTKLFFIAISLTATTSSLEAMGLPIKFPEKPNDPPKPEQPTQPEEPSKPPVEQPSTPPSTGSGAINARWEPVRSQGKDWSNHSFKEIASLGSSLLSTTPNDFSEFCPQFTRLSQNEKREFWVYFLSAMSQLESNHNPALSYKENFRDSRGNYIISRGLLQISIESGNGYGCGFRNENDLHDPYKNLSCGVRILDRWIGRDKRIAGKIGNTWAGGARYWSVLRTDSKVSQIKGWTKNYCQTQFK